MVAPGRGARVADPRRGSEQADVLGCSGKFPPTSRRRGSRGAGGPGQPAVAEKMGQACGGGGEG